MRVADLPSWSMSSAVTVYSEFGPTRTMVPSDRRSTRARLLSPVFTESPTDNFMPFCAAVKSALCPKRTLTSLLISLTVACRGEEESGFDAGPLPVEAGGGTLCPVPQAASNKLANKIRCVNKFLFIHASDIFYLIFIENHDI